MHVINSLQLGGAERLLTNLLPLQKSNKGIEDISLVVVGSGDDLFVDAIKKQVSLKMGFLPVYSFRALVLVYRLIKADKPDLVHVHLFPSLLYVAIVCRILGVPYAITEHNTSNGRRGKWYLKPLEYFMYNGASRIFSISGAVSLALNNHLPWLGKDIFIVPNGIDCAVISRQELDYLPGQRKEDINFLSIGRLVSNKGFDFLIEAFSLLPANYKLRIIGDGAELDSLSNLIVQYSLQDQVFLVGAKSRVYGYLKSTDFYVQPSIVEGFGIASLEAIAAGKVVFHSGCAGLGDVIGDAGVRLEMASPADCARSIRHFIESGNDFSEILSKGKVLLRDYDIARVADMYVEHYLILNN